MRTLIIAPILGLCLVAALGTVWWISSTGNGSALLTPGLDVPAGGDDSELPAGVDPPAEESDGLARHTISGQVTVFQEESGSIAPFAGVELRLAREADRAFDAPVARSRANRRGEFRFPGVAPGSYRVVAFPPEGAHAERPQVLRSIEVGRVGEPAPIAFHFGSMASGGTDRVVASAGELVGELSADPAPELAGQVDALELALQDVGAPVPLGMVPLIGQLLPSGDGRSQVMVFSSDGGSGGFTGEITISAMDPIQGGEPKTPESIDPEDGQATIRGQVTDSVTGAPLPSASVKLIGRNMDWSATTSADGAFVFRNVDPGEYSVSLDGMASGSIFRPSPANSILEVFPGQIQDVYLRAERVIVIENVVDGGQAQAAGMQPGDELLTYAGVEVTSQQHLRDLRAAAPEDQEVEVAVRRGGQVVRFVIHGGTIGVYTETRYR